jgi:hypothetical protein
MKKILTSTLLGLGLLAATLSADPLQRRASFTIDKPVAIPGAVIPAGTYEFHRLDPETGRHLIRIRVAGTQRVIATVPAVPTFRFDAPEKATLNFKERGKGLTPAVNAYWYPGEQTGLQLLYPETKSIPAGATVTD